MGKVLIFASRIDYDIKEEKLLAHDKKDLTKIG
jgi:hypothetical protein